MCGVGHHCLEPAHPATATLGLWEAVGNWEDCV